MPILPEPTRIAVRWAVRYVSAMGTPDYIRELRDRIGHRRLMVPSVAAIIRDDRGRLLLQRKAGPQGWSLPAGAIEPGETPRAALDREVREETGLEVKNAVLVAALGGHDFRHTYPNGDKVEYTVLVYRCEVEAASVEAIDPETVALAFFDARTMPALALPYPRSLLFGDEGGSDR